MLVMIDNYDSFTYNIVQYLCELGQQVEVFRNDEISLEEISALQPRAIVLSPGPCRPDDAGISMDVVRHFSGKLPVLGICLGHQSIAQVFGGRIEKADRVMHGKTSAIHHDGRGVFAGLRNPLVATRYHSLVINVQSVPADMEVSAWTIDGDGKMDEIMGIRHKTLAIEGVQFHPESILTEQGHELLSNFLKLIETEEELA